MLTGIYLVYLGLVLLSLNLDKHYKEVIHKNVNKKFKKTVAAIGTALLIVSLILFINNQGLSLGITYWIGVLAPAIVLIAMVFTYKPKKIVQLSILLLILPIISIIL